MEEAYHKLLRDLPYEERSLEKLDNFFNTYANEENKKELQFRRDSWKALILSKMERYEESLRYYISIYDLKDKSDVSFFNTVYGLTFAYHKLGRKNEAIQTAISFLDSDYSTWQFFKLIMLDLYVDILDGEEVPEKYAQMVEVIKGFIGVKTDGYDTLNSQIRDVCQKNKTANIRYSKLLIELDDSNLRKEAKIEKLKTYIAQEEVLFYKEMAEASLNNID